MLGHARRRRARQGGGLGKKLTEWVAWTDEYATRCPDCRATYAARKVPQEPPCHQCKIELLAENEDAARVYMLTRRQVVTAGMGQPVDISITAIKTAMELYGVRDQLTCLTIVRRLFHKMQEKNDEGRGLES